MPTTQPIPKNLREQMVKRIETAPEEDVVFVYELFLFAERDRLWKQIQHDAAGEQERGLWTNLPELIRAYRARNKPQA